MDLFNAKLARKRVVMRLRVEKYRVLRKRNRNRNPTENNINNSVAVPSSYTSPEELELSEIDNFQEQNFNSDIQSPTYVQNNFHLENETDILSDNNNTNNREDRIL